MAVEALRHEQVGELIEAHGDDIVFTDKFLEVTGLADYQQLIDENILYGLDPGVVQQLESLSALALCVMSENPFLVDGDVYPRTDTWRYALPDPTRKTYLDAAWPVPAITSAYFAGFAVRRRVARTPKEIRWTYPADLYLALSFVPVRETEPPFGIPVFDRRAWLRPAES